MKTRLSRYFGTKEFYKHALAISIPMILQNLVTNFVSMLDNIMVGAVGTEQMSGVSIVNQFVFVFALTLFGGVSGAGIFGTQFFGKGDHEGQKYTVRFRLILVTIVTVIFAVIMLLWGDDLIRLFLSEDDAPEMIEATLQYGHDYLMIMLLGMVPFGIGIAYSSVVRECGETKIPMIGSIAAIGVNLFLDYGLIFGNFGMPQMGVKGAAIATVIAKTIEALVVIIWAHTHPQKNRYIEGLYKGFTIPSKLTKQILKKGCPLLLNEFLWSIGMSVIAQSYSVRGLDVVAARNISSTLVNLFNVVFVQLGGAIGIIIGTRLGAGELEKAKEEDRQLIVFSFLVTMVVMVLIMPFVYVFPLVYNTTDEIRQLSSYIILMQAFAMPLWAFTNACYFTLRSGGKTGITFLFDFVYTWAIQIPLAFILTRATTLDFKIIFAIVTYSEILKVVLGYFLVRSGIWVVNLVGNSKSSKNVV